MSVTDNKIHHKIMSGPYIIPDTSSPHLAVYIIKIKIIEKLNLNVLMVKTYKYNRYYIFT